MSYPNNQCGECTGWLTYGEINKDDLIEEFCIKCKIFNEQRFIKHISTQCCYPLEEDGVTLDLCGCQLLPRIDGKFWEYTDKYTLKRPIPSNMFHSED